MGSIGLHLKRLDGSFFDDNLKNEFIQDYVDSEKVIINTLIEELTQIRNTQTSSLKVTQQAYILTATNHYTRFINTDSSKNFTDEACDLSKHPKLFANTSRIAATPVKSIKTLSIHQKIENEFNNTLSKFPWYSAIPAYKKVRQAIRRAQYYHRKNRKKAKRIFLFLKKNDAIQKILTDLDSIQSEDNLEEVNKIKCSLQKILALKSFDNLTGASNETLGLKTQYECLITHYKIRLLTKKLNRIFKSEPSDSETHQAIKQFSTFSKRWVDHYYIHPLYHSIVDRFRIGLKFACVLFGGTSLALFIASFLFPPLAPLSPIFFYCSFIAFQPLLDTFVETIRNLFFGRAPLRKHVYGELIPALLISTIAVSAVQSLIHSTFIFFKKIGFFIGKWVVNCGAETGNVFFTGNVLRHFHKHSTKAKTVEQLNGNTSVSLECGRDIVFRGEKLQSIMKSLYLKAPKNPGFLYIDKNIHEGIIALTKYPEIQKWDRSFYSFFQPRKSKQAQDVYKAVKTYTSFPAGTPFNTRKKQLETILEKINAWEKLNNLKTNKSGRTPLIEELKKDTLKELGTLNEIGNKMDDTHKTNVGRFIFVC